MPPGIYDSYELKVWLWDIKNLEPLAYRRYADLLLGRLCRELGFSWQGRPFSHMADSGIGSFLMLSDGWLVMHSCIVDRTAIIEIFTGTRFDKDQASWWTMRYLDAGISEYEDGG